MTIYVDVINLKSGALFDRKKPLMCLVIYCCDFKINKQLLTE